MTVDVAIDRYYDAIHAYIYGRTGRDDVFSDECCDNIFVIFSEKGQKLDEPAVYPWLMKTAGNKLKEYYRKMRKENTLVYFEDMDVVPCDSTDLSDEIITDRDIEAAKEKILSLLTPTAREMYECYYMQKMTYQQVADKFGISRNTASKRLHIIKKMLEDEVAKMFAAAGTATVLRIIAAMFDR